MMDVMMSRDIIRMDVAGTEEVMWMGLQMGVVSDCMCRDGSNEE
jgi:hypothetical protein